MCQKYIFEDFLPKAIVYTLPLHMLSHRMKSMRMHGGACPQTAPYDVVPLHHVRDPGAPACDATTTPLHRGEDVSESADTRI